MLILLEKHETATGIRIETVAADSKYGAVDNFLACHDKGLQAHIPDLRETLSKDKENEKYFPKTAFSMITTRTHTIVSQAICSSQNRCT